MYSSVGCWVSPSIGGLLSVLLVMALMFFYVMLVFEAPFARIYVDFEFE